MIAAPYWRKLYMVKSKQRVADRPQAENAIEG
jgi:hypothetical protein